MFTLDYEANNAPLSGPSTSAKSYLILTLNFCLDSFVLSPSSLPVLSINSFTKDICNRLPLPCQISFYDSLLSSHVSLLISITYSLPITD